MKINKLYQRSAFLRDPDEGGGGDTGAGQGGQDDGGAGDQGDQGQKDFVPITTQAEFDRAISARLAREKSKYADYDTLKSKASQWDELVAASMTEDEKTEAQIRAEVESEVMGRQVPKAVKAEFRAIARELGVPRDTLDSVMEDLDFVRYAKDDGEPDEDKITRKLKPFASAKDDGKGNGGSRRGPGFGQGNGHHSGSTGRPGEGGLVEAKRRFPEAFVSKP